MSNTDHITVLPFAPEQQPWVTAEPLRNLAPSGIESASPIYSYGLLVSQGRVNGKGLVSGYRTGHLTLTEEGVYL